MQVWRIWFRAFDDQLELGERDLIGQPARCGPWYSFLTASSQARRITVGWSFGVLRLSLALCAFGLVMNRNGRKADRQRRGHLP